MLFALVLLGTVVCIALIVLQVYLSKMGEHRIEAVVRRARKDIDKRKLTRAEQRLYNSMAINGWNYDAYQAARAANRTENIEQLAPFMVRMGRLLRVLPKNTFPWTVSAFLLLGEIYQKQGKTSKAIRLYEDLSNFFEGYGEDVPYAFRCWYFAQIHAEQANFEFKQKNYRGAVRFMAASHLERFGHLKATGNEIEAEAMREYRPSEAMQHSMEALERADDTETVARVIEEHIAGTQGRVNVPSLLRDIDSLLTGNVSRSAEEAELHATRDIIHRALSKAAERDHATQRKTEAAAEPDRPKTIILGE